MGLAPYLPELLSCSDDCVRKRFLSPVICSDVLYVEYNNHPLFRIVFSLISVPEVWFSFTRLFLRLLTPSTNQVLRHADLWDAALRGDSDKLIDLVNKQRD